MTATMHRDRRSMFPGSGALTISLTVALLAGVLVCTALAQGREDIGSQYATRRASLQDTDLEGRYNLAYWLFQNKAYDLASRELSDLSSRINDTTPEDLRNRIALLTRIINDRQKIESSASPSQPGTPAPAATTRPATTGRPTTQPTRPDPSRPLRPGNANALELPPLGARLTDDQINLIRLYEADLDQRPNVRVPSEVLDAIFTKYADRPDVPKGIEEQRAFRNSEGWAQLDLLFRLQARELYPKVRVRDDPPAMRVFRTELPYRYVMLYCGAANCHGGANAGAMFLYRAESATDRSVYTNFYVLNTFANAAGKVIDRDAPTRSLLIQYGLPRATASTPHPDVQNWRPYFSSENDPQMATIVAWIDSLFKPAPNYGINYTLPITARRAAELAGSTTQPAAASAAPPANAPANPPARRR